MSLENVSKSYSSQATLKLIGFLSACAPLNLNILSCMGIENLAPIWVSILVH